jgi:hypothetical protein
MTRHNFRKRRFRTVSGELPSATRCHPFLAFINKCPPDDKREQVFLKKIHDLEISVEFAAPKVIV